MSVISRLAEENGKSEGFVQAWADERGIVLDNYSDFDEILRKLKQYIENQEYLHTLNIPLQHHNDGPDFDL